MTIDMPREIPSAPAVSDSSALTSAQADSFKSFDNFQAMQNSRPDTTSGALPDLEIISNDGPGQEQKPPGDSNKPPASETQSQEQTPPGDPNKPGDTSPSGPQDQEQTPPGDPNKPGDTSPSAPQEQEQTPPGGRNPGEGGLPGQPQQPRDGNGNQQKDSDARRTEPIDGPPNRREDEGRNKPPEADGRNKPGDNDGRSKPDPFDRRQQ